MIVIFTDLGAWGYLLTYVSVNLVNLNLIGQIILETEFDFDRETALGFNSINEPDGLL